MYPLAVFYELAGRSHICSRSAPFVFPLSSAISAELQYTRPFHAGSLSIRQPNTTTSASFAEAERAWGRAECLDAFPVQTSVFFPPLTSYASIGFWPALNTSATSCCLFCFFYELRVPSLLCLIEGSYTGCHAGESIHSGTQEHIIFLCRRPKTHTRLKEWWLITTSYSQRWPGSSWVTKSPCGFCSAEISFIWTQKTHEIYTEVKKGWALLSTDCVTHTV